MSDILNLVTHIKNVSNSKFPLIQKESLFFIEESIANKSGIKVLIKELSELENDEAVEIMKKFCSLSDYANIIYENNGLKLHSKEFFKIVIDNMLRFALSNDTDISMSIIANIIGLFFLKGHSTIICEYLNDKLESQGNFVVIFSRILNHISLKYFEHVLSNLLILLKSNDIIKYICDNIANSILESQLIFVCQKMLFFQFYENDYIAVNASLLVSRIANEQQLSILKEILILWSDETSINKISFNHHFYLSKMLLLIFFQFKESVREVFFLGDNLSLILKGIYVHLAQPIKTYPLIGMVIAEALSSYCSYKSEEPLKFEYEETDVSKRLKKLINVEIAETVFDVKVKVNPITETGDGSDDSDFEPIESVFDNDVVTQIKRPFYVRDCFEGLSKTKPEDSEYFNICLDSVENLISNCPEASVEESIEYSRLLLHLHLEFEVDNFTEKQRNGLVALCCVDPVKVAKYLIGEFFSEHNGLSVRYNVLQVLTRAAQKLSGFNEVLESTNQITPKTCLEQSNNPKQTSLEQSMNPKQTSLELSKKSIRKTRYFFKRHKPTVENINLFNDYAKHFFYPLLSGGNQNNGFDVLVADFDLLSRYIYTLGIVVYCSAHFIGFSDMVKEYLIFLQSLRSHETSVIRIAVQVCFGICLIGLNGSNSSCIDDLIEYLTEWQIWLRTTYDNSRFELNDDFSSLIEKNLFLMRDLVFNATSSLLPFNT